MSTRPCRLKLRKFDNLLSVQSKRRHDPRRQISKRTQYSVRKILIRESITLKEEVDQSRLWTFEHLKSIDTVEKDMFLPTAILYKDGYKIKQTARHCGRPPSSVHSSYVKCLTERWRELRFSAKKSIRFTDTQVTNISKL